MKCDGCKHEANQSADPCISCVRIRICKDYFERADQSPKTRDEMKEFFTDAFKGSDFITPENIDLFVAMFIKRQPEVIKVEPKVLTVDEAYYRDYEAEEWISSDKRKNGYYMGFKAGKPQGKLEMWLEFERAYRESGPGTIAVFFNTLENLKPLKAEQ